MLLSNQVSNQLAKIVEYQKQGWLPSLPFPDNYFHEVFKYNIKIIRENIELFFIHYDMEIFEVLIDNAEQLFKNETMTGYHYMALYFIIYDGVRSNKKYKYQSDFLTYINDLLPSNYILDFKKEKFDGIVNIVYNLFPNNTNYMVLPYIVNNDNLASFDDINYAISEGVFLAGISLDPNNEYMFEKDLTEISTYDEEYNKIEFVILLQKRANYIYHKLNNINDKWLKFVIYFIFSKYKYFLYADHQTLIKIPNNILFDKKYKNPISDINYDNFIKQLHDFDIDIAKYIIKMEKRKRILKLLIKYIRKILNELLNYIK